MSSFGINLQTLPYSVRKFVCVCVLIRAFAALICDKGTNITSAQFSLLEITPCTTLCSMAGSFKYISGDDILLTSAKMLPSSRENHARFRIFSHDAVYSMHLRFIKDSFL